MKQFRYHTLHGANNIKGPDQTVWMRRTVSIFVDRMQQSGFLESQPMFVIIKTKLTTMYVLSNLWRSQNARKCNTHQRETTGSSNDSLQLLPFSKWDLLLKERISSQRKRILSLMSSSLKYGKSLISH